jgi:hypothetical protein
MNHEVREWNEKHDLIYRVMCGGGVTGARSRLWIRVSLAGAWEVHVIHTRVIS